MAADPEVLTQWLAETASKIGREICRLKGAGQPVPYLTFCNRAMDGDLFFKINGEKIKTRHQYVNQPQLSMPIKAEGIHEEEEVIIGYKTDEGIEFLFKKTEISWSETREDDERGDPLLAILKEFADPFFDGWTENDWDVKLFHIFQRYQQGSVSRLSQEVQRIVRNISGHHRSIQSEMSRLATARSQVYAAESMTLDTYKEHCESWRESLLNQGSLTIDRLNNLIFNLPTFTLQDQNERDVPLGPYKISFNLIDYSIKVTATENLSHGDRYPHPHVDVNGYICWGNGVETIQRLLANPNPLEILFTTAHFLKHGYHRSGAYVKLEYWLPPSGWYCEHCDVRHPDDTLCPRQCQRCSGHPRIMDSHQWCEDHERCFDLPGMCAQCFADLPKFTDLAFDATPPQIVGPFKYTNQAGREVTSSFPFVAVSAAQFSDETALVKDGNWFWVQGNEDSDEFLRRGMYIYKRLENESYELCWTSDNATTIATEAMENQEEQPEEENEAPQENQFDGLLGHVFQSGDNSGGLVSRLAPENMDYDDLPEQHRDTLRAFRRRSHNQRIRMAQRYIVSLNEAA